MSIIETKNLEFTYPTGTHALRGVNLGIDDGEVVAIIGQNGSGKTTLVRHFNGLLKPTGGEVLINGKSTQNQSVGELSRSVGYVFQNPNHQLFCKSVMEELEVGPTNFGMSDSEKKKNIEHAIELLELEPMMDEHPLMLDYTSKKILTIAAVLTFRPQVFIMDEPTGGLDEGGRKILRRTIRNLRDAGHTVLMISHDMDFVAETMDRVVVMAEGNIIQDTPVEKCFENEEVLKAAWIEPPQITQLGFALSNHNCTALDVKSFVKSYSDGEFFQK